MKKENEPIPPIISDGAKAAFENIYDSRSNITMEERFDLLMQEMIANAFFLIDRQRRTGIRPTDAEREFQEECMRQLKMIEKTFWVASKIGRRPKVLVNENFDAELLKKIKSMKGSMGSIVTSVPNNSNR